MRLVDSSVPGSTTIDVSNKAPSTAEEPQPESIGGYRVVRLLGVGGMGRVYEAEWPSTGQRVAIKLLSSQLTTSQVTLERFRQEGRLASQLHHPRCVFVMAADTEHNRPYIVMELMPGDTLKDLVDRRGPLPAQESIKLILDVIEGLQEAHRFGVIHRDVKPSNCFLMPEGRVKIGDFGLSKSLTTTKELTQSGAFLGTVLYASPEQIRGEAVDYASDVYSVSATLYHLLTGQAPFQTENVTAALARIISEDPPAVRSVRPDVPASVARVVMRGLERDRSRRYQTLEELRSALAALVPEQLTYGGLGIRVGAYILDEVLIGLFLVLPHSGLLRSAVSFAELPVLLQQIFSPLYFIVLEGRWGASFGKRLLGLRVCRAGSSDPPGFLRAALRTVVFTLLINVTLAQPRILLVEISTEPIGPHLLISAIPFIVGLLLLIVPMRRSNDFRGLHELFSGTCVMRLPRQAKPLRLTGTGTSPLLALPARTGAMPKSIGSYAIRTGVKNADGSYVLVGEDAVLGRELLFHVRPGNANAGATRHAVSLPPLFLSFPLFPLSIEGKDHSWEVFVGPAGRPLSAIAGPKRRLSWRETRPILEQLAEELAAANADKTMPAVLGIDQVWVLPDGRVQLLDFPIQAGSAARTTPLDLLKQTATLALEGQAHQPRPGESIAAPVPRHASVLLDRLFSGDRSMPDVAAFRDSLFATRDLPRSVDQPLRLVQLGVQAIFVGPGFLMMLTIALLFGFLAVVDRVDLVRDGKRFLQEEPAARDDLLLLISQTEAKVDRLRPALTTIERALVVQREQKATTDFVEFQQHSRAGLEANPLADWRIASALILACPLLFAIAAFIFRGGASFRIMGMSPRRANGQAATRWQCAARTLIIWLPAALLLVAGVCIVEFSPPSLGLRLLLIGCAVGVIAAQFAFAVAFPDRMPLDRWLRLKLVPR